MSGPAMWVRMHGFPYWPARLCSERELDSLVTKTKKTTKETSPVMFYGSKPSKAWVNSDNIMEFNYENCKHLINDKKLGSDSEYRHAVFEGLRVTLYSGVVYPEEFMNKMSSIGFEVNRVEKCNECGGTEMSGQALVCDQCDRQETHFHCLPSSVVKHFLSHPTDEWFCKACTHLGYIPLTTKTCVATSPSVPNNGTIVAGHNEIDVDQVGKKRRRRRSSAEDSQGVFKHSLVQQPSQSISQLNTPADNRYPSQKNASSGRGSNPVRSINTKEKEVFVETPQLPPDECFVCRGTHGFFLLCDYPHCLRLHHQVCVLKTVPSPMGYESYAGDSSDLWYCPAHFCSLCHSLHKQPGVEMTTMPTHLITSNVQTCMQMTHCCECPMSLCKGCEEQVSDSFQWRVFHASSAGGKGSDNIVLVDGGVPHINLTCANCHDKENSLLALARHLEFIWSFTLKSRLAIPFIRPLLPLTPLDGVDEAHVANSANTELDLLGILEKIRKLQYRSMEMFVGDFKIVRDKVKEKLIRTLNDTVAMNTSPLMQAIETLMDVVNMSVLKRAEALVNLEAAVQRECGESVAESVELEHVASVSIEDDDKRISINNPSECSIIRDKIVLEVIAEKQGVAVVECGSSNDILNREGADENARNYDDIFLSSFDPDFHVPYFFLQVIAYLKTNYDATSGKRLIARRDEVVIESMRRNFGFALGVYRKREGKWTSKALPTMTLTCEAYYINLFVAGDQMNSADGEILLAFIDKFEGLLYDYAEVWFDMLSPIGKECLRWGFTERNGIAAVAPLVHFKRLPPLVYFAELLKDVSHFHTGLNDGVGLARASGRPAIQQRLQALWRANCDHTFGLCSLSPVDAPYHQHALSVSAWTTLIESPPIPPNSQVSVDGGAEEKAVASLLRSASDMDAVVAEEEAIRGMLTMSSEAASAEIATKLSLQQDDVEISLARLAHVLDTAYNLQENLRRQYHEQRLSLVDGVTGTVTLGEMGLVRELKLANDCLRGRLMEQQRAIEAGHHAIQELKRSLDVSLEKTRALERQLQRAELDNIPIQT